MIAGDGQKIVGVHLAYETTPEDYYKCKALWHIPQVRTFLDKCYNGRTEDLSYEKFIYVSYCGVHEEYRNRGIGSKILEIEVGKLRRENPFPAIFVECTGEYSQRNKGLER